MGTGASTNGAKAISLDAFKTVSAEYDKLKVAGLTVEEMHMILLKRLGSMEHEDHAPQKEEESRPAAAVAAAPMSIRDSHPNLQVNIADEAKQAPTSAEERSNGLVLLIDDSPVAAKVASKVLTLLHFEVITAKSAKLGYDILLARKDEIILVFLDVVMPNVDGVECLQWIKDNPEVAHIPVYMLSGLEDQLLRDVCTERGAEGTLLKPLNAELVKAIIKAHNISFDNKSPTAMVSPTAMKLAGNKSDKTSDAIKTIISHTARVPSSTAPQVTVAIHSQGPAFKLCDSDFQVYTFPNTVVSPPAVYLVFIPTIYMTDLYQDNAFMPRLFALHERLIANGDQIVLITGDLPYALSAGKARFSFPFTIVSDPSLSVAERYVGTVDIGKYLAQPECYSNENSGSGNFPVDVVDYSEHPQNSFMAPNLGIVYISKTREVLNKWICEPVAATHQPNFMTFPADLARWAGDHEALRASQSAAPDGPAATVTAPNSTTGKHPSSSNTISNTTTSQTKTPAGSIKDTKKKILIVDDSSVSSRIACRKIENLGYFTACAYHGHSAFDMLKKAPHLYDVVLSDVMMPVCDGMELLRLIKTSSVLKHIPVIIISGMEGEELARNCLEHGAAALMKKPFDDAVFKQLVTRLLEAAEGQIVQS